MKNAERRSRRPRGLARVAAAAAFLLVHPGCKTPASSAVAPPRDAAVEGAVSATDGGHGARLTAQASVESLTWDASGKRIGYFRGDELLLVEGERFTRILSVGLPGFESRQLVFLADGGAVVVGTLRMMPTDGGTEKASGKQSSEQRLVIVSPAGTLREEALGDDAAVDLGTDPGGTILSPMAIDETSDIFARFLLVDRADASALQRIDLEVRGLRSAAPPKRVRMPDWFQGDIGTAPRVLGCRGSLCAFGVKGRSNDFNDAEQILAFVDLARGQARRLSVTLGPSAGIAFGPRGLVAVLHGGDADPVIVDTGTLNVRAFGRRGEKGDFMAAAGCVAFSPDGTRIAAAAPGEPVSLFDMRTGKRRWPKAPVRSCGSGPEPRCVASVAYWRSCNVRFTEDGTAVVEASDIGRIQRLDAATGDKTNELLRDRRSGSGLRAVGNQSWHTHGTLSPRARHFLLEDNERGDVLLDTASWTERPSPGGGTFSLDDRSFIVDNRVFDLGKGTWTATLP